MVEARKGLIVIFLFVVFPFIALSCCSEQPAENPGKLKGEEKQSESSLPDIMSHVNKVEGELNEPADARISGEVIAVAYSDKEGWLLLRVDSCRFAGPAESSLSIASGTELAIRFNPKTGEPREGERVAVTAQVMKSREGSVIIARQIESEGK